MSAYDPSRFPYATRRAAPYLPDIGAAHVAAWRCHRLCRATTTAIDRITADIRAMAAQRLLLERTKPAPRIDDADYLDGDYARCGSYTNAEWSE
jgi:hypothetical protein